MGEEINRSEFKIILFGAHDYELDQCILLSYTALVIPKKVFLAEGFDWDAGNLEKYWFKHEVSPLECEEVFFNQPLVVAQAEKHSQSEERFYALGRSNEDRYLFVAFTMRGKKIRIISARNMNRKERKIYGS